MKKGNQKNKPVAHPSQKRKVEVQGSAKETWRGVIARLAGIVFLGILIYSNSFDCGFHLDDRNSIMENTRIRDLSDLNSLWEYNPTRFIPYLTLALNYHFHELDLQGYHYVNLIIHLINACLVWWLVSLVFSTPVLKNHSLTRHKNGIAFIVALLFVSHPLATQSVTYIVQRLASISALFYLMSLSLYIKGRIARTEKLKKYLLFTLSLSAGVLAFLSKENAYTLPVAILLVELFFIQTKSLAHYLKDYRLWLILIGIPILVFAIYSGVSSSSTTGISSSGRSDVQNSIFSPIPPSGGTAFTVTSTNYLMTQFRVIVSYLQLLIVPVGQNVDHDVLPSASLFEPATFISFLLLAGLLVLSFVLYDKNRLASFGILWFFLTLAVESSIIPISDLMFEHRTYLPSMGFFLVLTTGAYHFLADRYRTALWFVFIGIIGVNSILTYQRNTVWKDELSLWSDAVSKSPNKARPYLNRGVAYWSQGQWEKAMADYEKAIALNPDYFSSAYCNMGVAQAKFNAWDKAIDNYSKAIGITARYTAAYDGRGVAYANKQEWEKAIADFTAAIEYSPDYAAAYYNRGSVYSSRSQWKQAIADYTKAIALDLNYLDAYCNRSVAFANLGQMEKAIDDCSKSISIDPRYVKAWFNRATTYLNMGKLSEAIGDYSAVIQLAPANPSAYYNRAVAYGNTGQFEKALSDYNMVIKIDPGNPNAYTGRDFAQSRLGR